MENALYVKAEKANGVVTEIKGCVSAIPVVTSGSGGTVDESYTAGLDELFCCGTL
jgi:hypothetical protein